MADLTRAQQKESASQLRKKLALEAELFRRMKRFFKSQNKYIFDRLKRTGTVVDASVMSPELEKILAKHYRKAADWYGPRVMREINAAVGVTRSEGLNLNNGVIAAAILAMIREQVTSDVAYLEANTNAEVSSAIAKEDSVSAARKRVNGRVISRADRHATNINQRAVEGTKQRIASSAQGAFNIGTAIIVTLRQKKTWAAIIDKATRGWHVSASGQTVDIDKPFIVSGEQLMFPGDFSLGATAKNLEHCRCISINSTRVA